MSPWQRSTSGRWWFWKAVPGTPGCLHLWSWGLPDHADKGLWHPGASSKLEWKVMGSFYAVFTCFFFVVVLWLCNEHYQASLVHRSVTLKKMYPNLCTIPLGSVESVMFFLPLDWRECFVCLSIRVKRVLYNICFSMGLKRVYSNTFIYPAEWPCQLVPSCWPQEPGHSVPHDWRTHPWWEVSGPHQWPLGLGGDSRPIPRGRGWEHCVVSPQWGETLQARVAWPSFVPLCFWLAPFSLHSELKWGNQKTGRKLTPKGNERILDASPTLEFIFSKQVWFQVSYFPLSLLCALYYQTSHMFSLLFG